MVIEWQDVKILHLEITTKCNAKCPQCARENPRLFNKINDINEISLVDFIELFDVNFIKQLDKVLLCGNFGDPATAKSTLEIFKYIRSINSSITLGMNTNGSVRNIRWWQTLGEMLSGNTDYCVFSIDGLADTNHIYRQNTNFTKIIDNVIAFINAGGNAHWDMLVYKHNSHQVNDANAMAKRLGFNWFRTKISKRFNDVPVDFLELPDGVVVNNNISSGNINCIAQEEKSIYVSANKEIYPCCWIGNNSYSKDSELIKHLSEDFDNIKTTWRNKPYYVCSKICSCDENNHNIFSSQWTMNKELV